MQKRNKAISLIIIIIAIISAVIIIQYVKANGNTDEKTMRCIAENSQLYVSKTCSACAAQKEILGNYTDYFNIIDCTTESHRCMGIQRVPTWLINGEKITGVKSIEKLKYFTGC